MPAWVASSATRSRVSGVVSRLDDDRAARRQGRHDLPHAPDHQREIPRNDARHHPDRLFFGPRLVTRLAGTGSRASRPAADLGGPARGVAHPVQFRVQPTLKGAGRWQWISPARGVFDCASSSRAAPPDPAKRSRMRSRSSRVRPAQRRSTSAPGGHHCPVDIRRAGVSSEVAQSPAGSRIPDG